MKEAKVYVSSSGNSHHSSQWKILSIPCVEKLKNRFGREWGKILEIFHFRIAG